MTFTGYSINGVVLNEGHNGWRILRDGTNTQGGVTNTLSKVNAPLRGGYIPAPHTFGEQIIVLQMRTPRTRLDDLLNLADSAKTLTRDDDATKVLRVELLSAIPSSDMPFDSQFDVTITLSAYDGVWRDATAVDVGPVTIASTPQTITLLSGISAPGQDGLIFLGGVFGQFVLKDAGGSWLKTTQAWPGTSTTGLLYNGDTGQAFKSNTSDPFTPIADMSQYIDVSGNGGFKLTPQIVSGNPAVRQVSLSLTTTTQSGVTLKVRAKSAYRMN